MTACLTRRAIFDVFEGDGTAAEHAHLAACGTCRARLREFESAVTTAALVMGHGRLPRTATHRSVVRRTLMPVAAMIAIAVGLAHWSAPESPERGRATAPASRGAPAVLALVEVSKAFAGNDAVDREHPPDSDVAYLQAALSGGWPCEGRAAPLDVRCN